MKIKFFLIILSVILPFMGCNAQGPSSKEDNGNAVEKTEVTKANTEAPKPENQDGVVISKWRGPNGNGVYNETGLLKEWPANGPEQLWFYDELGDGYSSPVFANGKIYITGMEEPTGYVYALDENGEFLWKASYGEEFYESYPGARGSVTVAGDLMYMLSGVGNLVCMSSENGKVFWSKNVLEDFSSQNIKWGLNETVVVDGDKVYCTPGSSAGNVVAFNRFTGEQIWTSKGKGELAAYCTPLLIKLPARDLLVTLTEGNILGIDAADGKLLWSHPQTNRWSVHANTPLYNDGKLFCFSGYGQGSVMLQLNEEGSAVSELWKNKDFDSRMGGAVLVDGHLYGSGDKVRSWQCVDWATGEQKYASTEIGKGTLISSDGMLFCYSDRGELALVKADPSGFGLVSEIKVSLGTGQHWAHLVINNGRLFVRHGNTLIAYKIK